MSYYNKTHLTSMIITSLQNNYTAIQLADKPSADSAPCLNKIDFTLWKLKFWIYLFISITITEGASCPQNKKWLIGWNCQLTHSLNFTICLLSPVWSFIYTMYFFKSSTCYLFVFFSESQLLPLSLQLAVRNVYLRWVSQFFTSLMFSYSQYKAQKETALR